MFILSNFEQVVILDTEGKLSTPRLLQIADGYSFIYKVLSRVYLSEIYMNLMATATADSIKV